jgi:hypothetical protein
MCTTHPAHFIPFYFTAPVISVHTHICTHNFFNRAVWQWAFKSAATEILVSAPWQQNTYYAEVMRMNFALTVSAALQRKHVSPIKKTCLEHCIVFLKKYDLND